MKKILFLSTFMIVNLLFAQTNWKIDPAHSKIGFSVTHMVISEVDGLFSKYDAKITTKNDDFSTVNVDLSVDVNSINTENEKRDQHLKSDDFFNAAKFSKITFKSKSVKKVSENKYKIVGDFTMRDVTKQVEFDFSTNGFVKDSWGNYRAAIRLTGEVNRLDYNLKWNNLLETGGAVVGKNVTIDCKVQLIKSN